LAEESQGLTRVLGRVRLPKRPPLLTQKTLRDSIVRLSPISLLANPVMLLVEITFFIVAAMAVDPNAFFPVASPGEEAFYVEVAAVLLVTVWFRPYLTPLPSSKQRTRQAAFGVSKLR